MKAYFNLNADFDLRMIPYSPACESDELEIRAQAYNAGGDGEVTFVFLLDGKELGRETVAAKGGAYAFARQYLLLAGKCGEHTVTVKLEGDADFKNDTASLPLTVRAEQKILLDGGFIMLGPPNDRDACDTFRDALKQFTEDDWRRYISEMHKIGQDCIIIMVCHQFLTLKNRDIAAHYPSALYPKSDIASNDPIAAILEEAQKNGQQVFVGVGNNYGYTGTPDDICELFERYKAYSSFYGWYLALELPMNLSTEKGIAMWQRYDELYDTIRALSPAKPILSSPYGMPSEMFGDYLVTEKNIDIMMPQDWAGQLQFTIEESEQMHRLLAPMCRRAHKHFWANCESFNFTDTEDGQYLHLAWNTPKRYLVPRFRGGGMVGPEGFDKQMAVARPHVEKIMNFMLTGFFTPTGFTPVCGGEASVRQYEDYVAYMKTQESL